MTAIRALNALAGLSIRESAAFLDARIDTVEAWSRGKNPTPPGVINELRALIAKQEAAAAEALAAIPSPPPDEIELGLASDDAEAQALGWPGVGAHRAALARVAAGAPNGVRVLIVPRGATIRVGRLRAAPPETDSGLWQPIETAPKDGTWIVIGKADWDLFPRAQWRVGKCEDEPSGWLFADGTTPCVVPNVGGEGFLGWQEDIDDGNMPDFWMPAPSKDAEEG